MNIVIVDDIYENCKLLTDYIQLYCINLPYKFEVYQNEELFLNDFCKNKFDIIFLDYYVKKNTGLEVARKIRKVDTKVILIFIIISRDYAIDSYKVKDSGYLVKPLIYEELAEIMSLLDNTKIHDSQFIRIFDDRILLKNIVMCSIFGHYTQVYLNNNEIKKYRITLSEFKKLLDPYPEFLHCYRGCIINMTQIKNVEDLAFIMSNGEYIPFRKKQKTNIMKSYSNYLFEIMKD